MARNRQAPADVADEQDQTALDALQLEGGEEIDLERVLASLGDSDEKARVILYRAGKPGSGDKDTWLRRFTPQEWLDYGQESVLADYGGGSYRVRVYDARSKLIRNNGFTLEEPRRASPFPLRSLELAHPPAAPVQNNDAILTAITGLQTSLATAFERIASVVLAQPKREDFLRELLQFKQLFAAPPAPPAPIVAPPDSLETFMKAVSFVKDNLSPTPPGETGPSDVFLEVARQFLPVIADNARAEMNKRATVPAPGSPAPSRAVHPGPPVPQVTAQPAPHSAPLPATPTRTTEEEMSIQLQMAVGFLVQQAANDSDPYVYAEVVLDQVDPAMIEQWRTAPVEDLLKWLAQYNPGVNLHVEWFKRLHAAINEILADEGTEGAPSADPVDPLTSVTGASIVGDTGDSED